MATIYPSGIDNNVSIPQTIDLVTPVVAEVTNTLRDAIIAIEAELGIDPSREYGTVRARLDDIQSQLNCGSISVSEDGVIVVSEAVNLNFIGGVTVTDTGSGTAQIEIIGGGDGYAEQESFTPSASQTIFTLSLTPSDDTTVMMFVNGIKYEHGLDYTVSGTAVTYLNAYVLGPTDTVEFWYLVEGGGGGGSGTITVQDEGLTIDSDTSIINFIGTGVTAASGGAGIINVTVSGGSGLGLEQESLPVLINGQQAFVISEIPIADGYVMMFVNGMKQQYGVDYFGVGTSVTYNDVDLITTDVVEFFYYTFTAATAPPGGIQTLADTLALGNVTGGNNIVISASDNITNTLGSSLDINTVFNGGGNTDNIIISTGDSGAGNSGDIFITPGTATGTRGSITLDSDFTANGDGYVFGDFAISGKLSVDGLIDPTGLVLVEQAVAPYSPAGAGGTDGVVWVRDDGYLVFTNQSDIDFVLGDGTNQTLGEVLNNGNLTEGSDIVLTSGDVITAAPGDAVTLVTTGAPNAGDINIYSSASGGQSGDISIYMESSGISGSFDFHTTSSTASAGNIDFLSSSAGNSGNISFTSNSVGGESGDVSLSTNSAGTSGNFNFQTTSSGGVSGNIEFISSSPGNSGNISFTSSSSAGQSGDISLITSSPGTSGIINLTTTSTSGVGGAINIVSTGVGVVDPISIRSVSTSGGPGGTIEIESTGTSGASGPINITVESVGGAGNEILIRNYTTNAAPSGNIRIQSDSASDRGGSVIIRSHSNSTLNAGGEILIEGLQDSSSFTTPSITLRTNNTGLGPNGISSMTIDGASGPTGSVGFVFTTAAGSGGLSGGYSFNTGDGNSGGSGGFEIITGPGDSQASGGFSFLSGTASANETGSFSVTTGNNSGAFNSGSISFATGDSSGGVVGPVTIQVGHSLGGNGDGGQLDMRAGDGNGTGVGGSLYFAAGDGGGTSGIGGSVDIQAGTGGTNQDGGYVNIISGAGSGTGVDGLINIRPGGSDAAVFSEETVTSLAGASTGDVLTLAADGSLKYTSTGVSTNGDVQTTDATQTTVASYTTSVNNTVYSFTAEVTGIVAGGDAASYEVKGTFKRIGGTVTQIGSTLVIMANENNASWGGATFDISGSDIRVRVTGLAATTIDWQCFGNIKVGS